MARIARAFPSKVVILKPVPAQAVAAGRTTKNTDQRPLGESAGISRMMNIALQIMLGFLIRVMGR